MAKAFLKIELVDTVNFYFFSYDKKLSMHFEDKKIIIKPIYLPLFHDINEEKSIIYKIIHIFYYPLIIFGFFLFFIFAKFKNEDILFIRSEKITLAVWLASFFKKINFSFEIHNYEMGKNKFRDFIFKKYLVKSKKAVTVSNYTQRNWIKNGIAENKIMVVPSGFDPDLYKNINFSKENILKELKITENKKIATYVGSVQKYRGIEEIIYAAKYLNNVEFMIIGGGNLNYYKEYVEKKYGLLNNLHLKGFIDNADIPKYLISSDVLLAPYSKKCPTVNHMSSVKLFEYMASGIPIIISDFPSIREVVSNKEVIFSKPDNPNDLSEKIKMILEREIDSRVVSENAKKLVEKFSWNNRALKIFENIRT